MQFKKGPLSTDLHVLFHRPVAVGEAVIEVRIIKLGQKLATVEGKLFNADNKLAATLLHTIQPSDMTDAENQKLKNGPFILYFSAQHRHK